VLDSLITSRHYRSGKGISLPKQRRTHSLTPPLYQLLQQRNVSILVASDGSHKTDYGSFGWVIGTKDEVIWDCQGTARGYPMLSYRAEGYGRMSLLLFLTYFIRYYDIQPPDDLRVTSYCDNFSILTKHSTLGI
jgi:hypothetical protein